MKALASLFLVVLMVGCAAKNTQLSRGEISPPKAESSLSVIADDALEQLNIIFPAATTRFKITESMSGRFGQNLLDGLRKSGYALAITTTRPLKENTESRAVIPSQTKSFPFDFVLDQPSANLYRITIMIGDNTLSRAYAQVQDEFFPAGSWVMGGQNNEFR